MYHLCLVYLGATNKIAHDFEDLLGVILDALVHDKNAIFVSGESWQHFTYFQCFVIFVFCANM